MNISEINHTFIYEKKHRKMVWSMIVEAWDQCNIVMPAHKVLGCGYVWAEKTPASDWFHPPSGPPYFT